MKKLAAILPEVDGEHMDEATDAGRGHRQAGCRYLHSALDDRSRLVYSETHDDEQGSTAAGSGDALMHGSGSSAPGVNA